MTFSMAWQNIVTVITTYFHDDEGAVIVCVPWLEGENWGSLSPHYPCQLPIPIKGFELEKQFPFMLHSRFAATPTKIRRKFPFEVSGRRVILSRPPSRNQVTNVRRLDYTPQG
jgi:hypothetical protein